jgi:membrane fusion protein, multidrug efflux system
LLNAAFLIFLEGNNMAHTIQTLQTMEAVQEKPQGLSAVKVKVEELDQPPKADAPLSTRPRRVPRWALFLAPIIVVAVLLSWWLYARDFESTDDAQIDGHLDAISARITGTVVYINPKVEDDQYVEVGTLLVELDPNDYKAELDHAKAELATREAVARSAGVNVPITGTSAFSRLHLAEAARAEAAAGLDAEGANLIAAQHKVEQDEAVHARAERDRVRYQALVEKHEISRSDYDARETEAVAAAQALESDRAVVEAVQRKIAQARSLVVERQAEIQEAQTAPQQIVDAQAKSQSSLAEVERARADVRTAELNLGYTKIYAPVSGVIGRKTVELGQRIQPGQSLLAIVPLDDIWVTADFKETQLKYMRTGETVSIHVDTFGRDYKGTVENLPGAAGTLFSLLPPENASGNFVKVVQRLPVRIRFNPDQDPQHLLRPGMSVEPKVRVR